MDGSEVLGDVLHLPPRQHHGEDDADARRRRRDGGGRDGRTGDGPAGLLDEQMVPELHAVPAVPVGTDREIGEGAHVTERADGRQPDGEPQTHARTLGQGGGLAEQHRSFAGVAAQPGGQLEFGAGLPGAAQAGQQLAADARQQV